MYGAILGDIIGSPFEFDRGGKTKDFPLFSKYSQFTDDTVMTVAVAEALLEAKDAGLPDHLKEITNESLSGPGVNGSAFSGRRPAVNKAAPSRMDFGALIDSIKSVADKASEEEPEAADVQIEPVEKRIKWLIIKALKRWGSIYPDAGYGARFGRWIFDDSMGSYNSYGNGSAMRVSSAGWLYRSLEDTRRIAALTASVTHDHPEGIKGAESVASAIFLARTGGSKEEIKTYIEQEFGYDLSRSCDEIRPGYYHVESCQESVPEAITAFLEGKDFEDVVRTAVSLGGDTDTIACIAGSMAEAFYGVPDALKEECLARIPKDMRKVLKRFDAARKDAGTSGTGVKRQPEKIVYSEPPEFIPKELRKKYKLGEFAEADDAEGGPA